MLTFGKNLQAIRIKRGITQQQLAIMSKISQSRISNYERGKQEPTISTLAALARSLNCTFDELLGHPDNYAPLGQGGDGEGNISLSDAEMNLDTSDSQL